MSALLIRGYEVVIGIETHVQLSTQSKIFSAASTQFGAAPNTQACAVDMALPGTLPVMNKGAVERAIAFGLAVGAHVAPRSIFARKNYFYPDLPKGYQISQYEIPVVQGGTVSFFVGDQEHTVRLVRAHLEEDAGKSLHDDFVGFNGEKSSGIDLNRAGTPLLEIVTEPDMRASKEAAEYARALHALVVWLGICDGNMQEGSFRCDVNVSVRKPGAPLGTRREIKNLNSFKFLQQATDFEINWQIDQIEDGLPIQQATVLFNPDTGETRAMRTKEDAHDYRYFPDPDLLPLVLDEAWVASLKAALPELPDAKRARFMAEYGLPAYDAGVLVAEQATADFYETVARGRDAKLAANWVMGDFFAALNRTGASIETSPVSAAMLGRLLDLMADGTINGRIAKELFEAMVETGREAAAIVEERGLRQVTDTGAIEAAIAEVLARHADKVAEYRAGKDKLFGFFVGQVMKAMGGRGNPALVNEVLKKALA
jgi:aspartyl-tRNA(Asn)/glutamyl-tRNA(Gln) amidotransferase subunit B